MLQNSAQIWKMYTMLINKSRVLGCGVLLAASFLFSTTGLAAEMKTDVSVRYNKHEGFNRIVFEAAEDSFITNTVVTQQQNQIKVLFPLNISLKAQGTLDIETSFKDRIYIVKPNSPFSIKVLKLSSPPRLSIDIMPQAKEEVRKPVVTENAPPAVLSPSRIVIDPGHGGYDLGIISGELREKDITLSLARTMESALMKKNKTVLLTRKADQYLSLVDRALSANQRPPDIFISIHLSLTDNFVIYTSVGEPVSLDSPAEMYGLMYRQKRYTEKSRLLAEGIGKAVKDELKKDVVYRKMDLPLLISVGAPAVMVEVPKALAYDPNMKAKISDTLIKGIAVYATQ